jgi:hypothetical protein
MVTPVGTDSAERTCLAGRRCRGFDHQRKHAALLADPRTPLCPDCLMVAERDVRALVFDYVDLEQHLAPSLGEWSDGQPSHRGEPPAPMRTAVEALQREIWHATTAWARELRARSRLSEPPVRGVRDGWAVQRAVEVLAPRLELLARVEPTVVFPTGVEDGPQEVPGWAAVLQLSWLHQRARSMLGRTRRTTQVPGRCSGCGHDELFRDEPRYSGDPCPVYCGRCNTRWTYDQYERYVGLIVEHTRQTRAEPAGAAA